MKIKNGLVLRDICGEKVVIAEGIENIDFSKMIRLNETSAFLWEKSVEMETIDEVKLCDALLAEYDTTPEEAMKDISLLLTNWKELGLLTD